MELSPEAIAKIIKDAVHDELGEYKVPKEQHYQDHLWLKGLRDFSDKTTSTFWRTIIMTITGGIVTLIVYGFIFFGKKQLGE